MTPQGVRIELTDLVSYLLQQELALAFRAPVIRPILGGRREVSPPLTGGRGSRIGIFGTLRDYRMILQGGDYLAVLADGSIIQTAFVFEANGTLCQHRLAFFPCPVVTDLGFADQPDDLETLVGLALDEFPIWPAAMNADGDGTPLRLRPPIRFDYDSAHSDALHSPSHAHIAVDACRLPVAGPLSVGHFVRFVFRNFIPEIWREHEKIREWRIQHAERTVRDEELEELFLDTRRRVS